MGGSKGWIGVDLDGTLAHYDGWKGPGHIGEPIKPMFARVKRWLANNTEVRIVTARAALKGDDFNAFGSAIAVWLVKHFGADHNISVTCCKDFDMIELWDDRAVTVEKNTGKILTKD